MATEDKTEMYVTGVLYQQSAFPDNPQNVFDIVDEAFREIADLSWDKLCVNRSENRFSSGITREQLLIFMHGITYDGDEYLSDTDSNSLRNAIKGKLDNLSDITYVDVEVRSFRVTI